MRDLLMGIDVGTTAMKAAVFDVSKPQQPLSVGRAHSDTTQPRPGWSERDPDDVLVGLRKCIGDAIKNISAVSIRAIGISGTACGAWLVANKRPVRPAIMWNDGRATPIVSEWHRNGTMSEVFERSGNIPFPGYTLPVLRWLLENERESLERSDIMLFCKDWIRGWLTDVWGSDETDASYAPFGIRERQWDDHLLDITGTSGVKHLLPELQDPHRVDSLRSDVASELGLSPGIPVALGATDIIAGCVGGGAVDPGHAVSILGTSANSSVVTETPEFEPREIGIMAAAPLNRWVRTMLNTSGSMTLDWAAQQLSGGDVSRMFDLAADANLSDLPILLPYLAGAGVVSPFVDAKARGAYLGLRVDHGPKELARAAVEGLAFAVADSYDSMPTNVVEITAIGGAARSDLLLQTISDACEATVIRPRGEEFGARGVALLAAHSAGLITSSELSDAVGELDVDRRFEPAPERVAERLKRYRACSRATRELGKLW